MTLCHILPERRGWVNMKHGNFTLEKLYDVLRKIKSRKADSFDEEWKTKTFDDLRFCDAVFNQEIPKRWKKSLRRWSRNHQKYGGIGFTSIEANVYNALHLNRNEPEKKNVLWKKQKTFWRNRSTTSKILRIRRIIEVRAKNIEATYLLVDFSQPFNSIHSVCQWSGRPGFNPKSRHTKDFKNGTWYLLALRSAI